MPVLYKGRVRPFESYSKNYLYALYHQDHIEDQELAFFPFSDGSAISVTAYIRDKGPSSLNDSPIIYLPSKSLQKQTGSLRASPKTVRKLLTAELPKEDADFLKEKLALLEHPPVVFSENFPKGMPLPSHGRLWAENLYNALPLTSISILIFLAGLPLLLLPSFKFFIAGRILFVIGLFLLTCNLALRWYILARPPVANMAETIFYVPWAAGCAALLLSFYMRASLPLFASSLLSIILLSIMQLSGSDQSLENVQAVLNSPFWLTIHVLMIVASYGLLLLAGILGHLYLILYKNKPETLFKALLFSMYGGLVLLIPGTLLGGVWAAQSWGRFWDWDPKESWAFITCCIYLLFIHAYRFKKIGTLGVAIGSILGLIAVSFTWYGVNYILGTGLHSYGFGNGGEIYYYGFVGFEFLFVLTYGLRFKREIGIKS